MANKLPASRKQHRNDDTAEHFSANQKAMRPKQKWEDMSRPVHQIVPVVFFTLAVFFLICFFIKDSCAIVGDLLRTFFFGAFGRLTASFILPVALIFSCFSWRRSVRNHTLRSLFVSLFCLIALFSCLVYTVANETELIEVFDIKSYYSHTSYWSNGGIIGCTLSFLFVNLLGKIGTYLLTALIIIIFAIVSFGFTPSLIAERLRDRAASKVEQKTELRRAIREEKAAHKENYRRNKDEIKLEEERARLATLAEERKQRYEEKLEEKKARNELREEDKRRKNAIIDEVKKSKKANRSQFTDGYDIALEDDDFASDEFLNTPTKKSQQEGSVLTQRAETLLNDLDPLADSDADDIPPQIDYEEITERIKPTYSITVNNKTIDPDAPSFQTEDDTTQTPDVSVAKKTPPAPLVTPDMISTKTHIDVSDKPTDSASASLSDDENEREKERQALAQMYASYKFPPFDLLSSSEKTDESNITEEINQNAEKLVETLNSFNVKTKITSVSRGPRITRYELVPNAGIRIRSIANLIDDISMNLASAGIRIEAPIPGKAAVGIEVPNKTAATVHLRELLENDTFRNAAASTTVCVGADVTGDPVFCDLAKMPHTLIAGATGMGKSVCINVILISLLYKARPDDVKLILVDPKKVELGVYNGIPHLLVPVVIDPKKATGALSWAVCEMERRFDLIEEAGVRDIKGYNKTIADHPEREKLPHIIIVIDELNDLMMVASDSVETSICRIAQKARAAGIHLIIGTQRPSVDVITGTIKANIPSRIAFHVASQIDSRTILDAAGADKLLNNGDMLFFPVGYPKPLRVQGAFISDSEVEKVTSHLKAHTPASTYSRDIMAEIDKEAEKCDQSNKRGASETATTADGDETLSNPKFREAVEIAIDEGKISTSLLQRRLKLGFGKAARFIDIMERMGIVSKQDGQKPRTTLIGRNEFYQLLNSASDRSNANSNPDDSFTIQD